MNETLANLGEEELLQRLKKFMHIGQIDDDTAEINTSNSKVLINTDLLVEEVHFSELTLCPEDVGWKAIASNVSDLIASGSDEMVAFTVGLVAPPNTPWPWVEGVYKGIREALQYYGGELVGGDCSKGKQKMLSITAIGTISSIRLHRSNALPGDYLITSGFHGLSRLGLAILNSEPVLKNITLSDELIQKALKAHKRPTPPKDIIAKLIKTKPTGKPLRAAGTDSSDGLLAAIQNLCISSGCQAILNKNDLPREIDWPIGNNWDNWCLSGGEDYELVLSLPKDWADKFIKTVKNSKIIGCIKAGKPIVKWNNGKVINSRKFKHF